MTTNTNGTYKHIKKDMMFTTIRADEYEEAIDVAENYSYEGRTVKGPFRCHDNWVDSETGEVTSKNCWIIEIY
ncbi:MAG TPA: hypothetical protein EYQ00_03260 [Dehalococcoidia bacterium]|nr:hypothetical protein [Dehalococcoidia bacterium]